MKLINPQEVPLAAQTIEFDPAVIRHAKDLIHRVIARHQRKHEETIGYPTQWTVFNSAFGGLRPGELITLTSDTGIGKSTFALNLALHAVRSGRPALIFSLENGIDSLAMTIAQMITKKPFVKFESSDVAGLSEILERIPLYFYAWSGQLKDELVVAAMEYAADKHGVCVCVIDHLDYLVKTRESWQSEAYVIGDCMRRLVGSSKRKRITTLLCAHPAKLNQSGWKRREVGLDELKGSSSIKQESDAVFGLHRPKPEENITQLRFLKIRNHQFGRFMGGKIRFKFEPENLSLEELSTGVEWGE